MQGGISGGIYLWKIWPLICRNLYIKPYSSNLGLFQFLEVAFADNDTISFLSFSLPKNEPE